MRLKGISVLGLEFQLNVMSTLTLTSLRADLQQQKIHNILLQVCTHTTLTLENQDKKVLCSRRTVTKTNHPTSFSRTPKGTRLLKSEKTANEELLRKRVCKRRQRFALISARQQLTEAQECFPLSTTLVRGKKKVLAAYFYF